MYTIGEKYMYGSYEGNIKRARVYVNGVGQAIGGTFLNGKYDYYINAGITDVNDLVEIEGWNENNEVIASKKRVEIK
ncbi:immunoglobulin-like domain-containing protein [Enterococcus sp. C50]|uniref:immunoglobulin-like domain-containing protein n=1 Tax=Enterococcus sp. C50 TaxID=3231311 RepID=UPI0034A08C53